MQKSTVENRLADFKNALGEAENAFARTRDELDSTLSEIRSLAAYISGLFAEKREAYRDEKPHIQSQIEDLLSQKRDLYKYKDALNRNLRDHKEKMNQARSAGKSLYRTLRSELSSLDENKRKIDGSQNSQFSRNLSGIKSTLQDNFSFVKRAIDEIDRVLDRDLIDREYHFEIVEPYFQDRGEHGLRLLEPPISDVYLSNDGRTAVPLEAYTVYDSLDSLSDSVFSMLEDGLFSAADGAQKIGDVAVEFACALLRSCGHSAVWKGGGPGQPDIMSLDAQGKLWISESKGTFRNAFLPNTGLERRLDSRGGDAPVRLMENSPAWLMRKVGSTLNSIELAIGSSADPIEKVELQQIRDAYLQAARNNFRSNLVSTQIVQVGVSSGSASLKPPYSAESGFFDRWVDQTAPEKIVQIDVVLEADHSG